jgi:hypothetical protein
MDVPHRHETIGRARNVVALGACAALCCWCASMALGQCPTPANLTRQCRVGTCFGWYTSGFCNNSVLQWDQNCEEVEARCCEKPFGNFAQYNGECLLGRCRKPGGVTIARVVTVRSRDGHSAELMIPARPEGKTPGGSRGAGVVSSAGR